MTVYIIRNADNTIKTFSERQEPDSSLQPGETQESVAGTMAEYAGRLALSVSKSQIVADGIDEASVIVSTNTNAGTIAVDVNGVTENVTMTNGTGEIVVSAEVAGAIVFTPADKTLYAEGGNGAAVVIAVEA